MRFSGSAILGNDGPSGVFSRRKSVGALKSGQVKERRNKFALMNFGLGFLAFVGLALWMFETKRFGPLEASFAGLSALPVALAFYARKPGTLKFAEIALTAMLALMIATLGTVFREASQACLFALSLLPAMALTHEAKFSTVAGSVFSALGMAAVTLTAASIDPLNVAALGGLWALSSTFSLQAKLKFEKFKVHLVAERARFQLSAEAGSELITCHDRTGTTLYASPASSTLLGIPAHELLKSGLIEKVHLQDRVGVLKAISDAADVGTEQAYDFRLRSKANSKNAWRQATMRCVPTLDEVSGEQVITMVTRDVTDLKCAIERAEAAEEKSEADLEIYHHMLDSMKHSVRKPLGSLVEKCIQLDPKNVLHQRVSAGAYNVLTSLENLVDAATLSTGYYRVETERFSAKNAIEDALAKATASLAAGRPKITVDIPEALPELKCDRHAVARIFSALLAAAFTSSGARKTLSLRALRHGPCIHFTIDNVGTTLTGSAKAGLDVATDFAALLDGQLQVIKHSDNRQSFKVTLPVQARAKARIQKSGREDPVRETFVDTETRSPSATNQSPEVNQLSEGAPSARVSA